MGASVSGDVMVGSEPFFRTPIEVAIFASRHCSTAIQRTSERTIYADWSGSYSWVCNRRPNWAVLNHCHPEHQVSSQFAARLPGFDDETSPSAREKKPKSRPIYSSRPFVNFIVIAAIDSLVVGRRQTQSKNNGAVRKRVEIKM